MNFTHLVDATQSDPDQRDLQKFDYFLLVFVLSEDFDWVMSEVDTELRATDRALCWIIHPEHLKMAPYGSALRRVHDVLRDNPDASTIEHSFIAWMPRQSFLRGEKNVGKFVPLYLHADDDMDTRRKKLQSAVYSALGEMAPSSTPIAKIVQWIPPAFELITFATKYL